jgi:FMN-dependent NADH-azoreductase
MNILQINSSIRGAASASTSLATRLVERLRGAEHTSQLVVRDFGQNPHPILDEAALVAHGTPAESRTREQAARVAFDNERVAEIQNADVIVVSAPMYNFGISVQLKSWIDAIARAGVTFRYTANGPEGLLKGKKMYIVFARGGKYHDTPADTQTPYLRALFGLLGITDIEFIYAEGLNMGPEFQREAFESAHRHIDALTTQVVAEAA